MHYKLKKKLCSDENICNCGDRLVINGTAKCGSYTKPANRTYIGADIPVTVSLVTNSLKLGSGAGFYLTYQGMFFQFLPRVYNHLAHVQF